MILACLVCHSVESPSHSFRSYSVSSSDNEGRCSAVANCLARKSSLPSVANCLARKSSLPSVANCLARKSSLPSVANCLARKSSLPSVANCLARKSSLPSVANCLARKSSLPSARPALTSTSKVTPQPNFQNSIGMAGPPRLVRSRAVRRDIVRDWNFDETVMER